MRYRLLLILSLFILVAPTIVAPIASADVTCDKSLPAEDCASIIGNWPSWLPGTGACNTGTSSVGPLTGNDNVEKSFNYFIKQGLTDAQSAGIVGNMMVESGISVNPMIIQGGGTSKNPADAGGGGYGIIQWTPGSKLVTYAGKLSVTGNIYELAPQLDVVWGMLSGKVDGEPNLITQYKTITNVKEATDFITDKFERPAQASANKLGREKFAGQVIDTYGGTTSGAVSGSNAPSCNSSGTISCTPSTPATAPSQGALSPVRQNVVCLANAEYALWKSGKEGPSPNKPYSFFKYTENNDEEWCADFTSWIYNQAGYPIGVGKNWRVAGVPSVKAIGEREDKFIYHGISTYVPKPGDMAIYGSEEHINLVVSVNENTTSVTTIGGNQGNIHANNMSLVSENTVNSYYGLTSIGFVTGYVSPKD